jgi:hypothetical protein
MLKPSSFIRLLGGKNAYEPQLPIQAACFLAAAKDNGILDQLAALRWDLLPCRTESDFRHYAALVTEHCGVDRLDAILSEATALFADMLADPEIVNAADFDAAQVFEALVCGLAQECAAPAPVPALHNHMVSVPIATLRLIEEAFEAVPFTPQLAKELELRPVRYTSTEDGYDCEALVLPSGYMIIETGEFLSIEGKTIADLEPADYTDIPVVLLAYASLLPLIENAQKLESLENRSWLLTDANSPVEAFKRRLQSSALGRFKKPVVLATPEGNDGADCHLAWKIVGEDRKYVVGQIVQYIDDNNDQVRVLMRDDFPRATTSGIYVFPLADRCVVCGVPPNRYPLTAATNQ